MMGTDWPDTGGNYYYRQSFLSRFSPPVSAREQNSFNLMPAIAVNDNPMQMLD